MKNSPILVIIFYLGLAVCLWPLYVAAVQVVAYVQQALAAHTLAKVPPVDVIVAAVQTALLVWAIVGAVLLYRRGQDSMGWLVIFLVLAPSASALVLARF